MDATDFFSQPKVGADIEPSLDSHIEASATPSYWQEYSDLRLIIERSGIRALVVDQAWRIRQCTPGVFDLVPGAESTEGLLAKLSAEFTSDYNLEDHISDVFSLGSTIEREARTYDGRSIIVRVTTGGYFEPGDCVVVKFLEIGSPMLALRTRLAAKAAISHDAIISVTTEGIITSWNTTAEQLFRRSASEMTGQPLEEIMLPEHVEDLRQVTKRVLHGDEAASLETLYRIENRKEIFVSIQMSPMRDLDGRIIGAVVLARDITDRKLAEIALKQERDRAQRYLDIAGAMMVVVGADLRVQLINQKGCEILGTSEHDIVGKDWFESFVPEFAHESTRQIFDRLLAADGTQEHQESHIITCTGEHRLIAWHHTTVRDENGVPSATLSSGEDITESRKIEEALRRSEEQFRRAIINAPVPVILHADDGEILNVSRACTELTGYTQEDLPTIMEWRKRAHRQRYDTDRVEEPVVRLDESRYEGEFVVMTRDGSRRIWEFYSARLGHDARGRQLVITTATDITERRNLERQILEISGHERTRIGRDLHDCLASHLSGIAMLSRGLIADADSGRKIHVGELEEIAQLAREGAEQARALAHGLTPWELEPDGLVLALSNLASTTERQTGITCTLKSPGPLARLRSEVVSQIYLIAREAVSNATRHSGACAISIGLNRTITDITLSVEDNGRGIDLSKSNGDGIGIRIMRYRANMIGGDLTVGQSASGGVLVTCVLPMADVAELPAAGLD